MLRMAVPPQTSEDKVAARHCFPCAQTLPGGAVMSQASQTVFESCVFDGNVAGSNRNTAGGLGGAVNYLGALFFRLGPFPF